MREILFRGKRLKDGEWVCGSLIVYPDGYCSICSCSGCNDILNKFDVIPETVGEFTGLTDRNGKKIFEGDIIKLKDYHGLRTVYIFWGTRGTWFYGGDGYSDEYIFNSSKREVIGNIHDNPELLNVEF